MGDPISLTMMALSTAMGAAGSAASGASQSAMDNYQAGIAAQNQKIDQQNAGYALIAGEGQAAKSGAMGRFRVGQTRDLQGKSNFNVNSGSPAAVVASEQQTSALNQTAIRSSAAKEAYDYNIGATGAANQAAADRSAAANARTTGDIGIASSLIGGASNIASKWSDINRTGWNMGF